MTNIEKFEPKAVAPQAGVALTPFDMLNRAVETGAGIEVLEKLMGLQERWEATQARKAFDSAIAMAKGEIGPIVKDKTVDFTGGKGRTNYKYEGFDTIARAVDPILNKHGLSYRFRASQEGQRVKVTCIIAHMDGYSEETTLEVSEDHSGNKNAIQAIGSAVTYLQRYSLKLALGLAATNDDDGRTFASAQGPIDDEQIAELQQLIVHVDADMPRFLKYFKVERLEDLPAARFADATRLLRAKESRHD